jgi:hypothetical protein
MSWTPKSLSILALCAVVSLSVHACVIDDLPSDAADGGAPSAAGAAGEGGGPSGSAGESAGGAGTSGGGAGVDGGAPQAGDGGTVDPPHPCDTPVCQPGQVGQEQAPCGECNDMITRTRTCRADTCTWGEWGAWSACAAECQPDHWRCCGTGQWEWCYKNTCRWTGDCAACSSGSCNCP